MKKTVLVTGGAGFIGSHVTVELIQAGYEVIVADNFVNSDAGSLDGVEAITGVRPPFYLVDTCDAAALATVFDRHHIDCAIHFAAYKAVGESVSEPLKYYLNNMLSFMNLLEAMRRQGGRANVLFSSSATVYGEPEHCPVTEQSPRQPATSPYGNTKQMAEDILRDCCTAYDGFNGIALRYFNPVGAHPSARIGELPIGVPNNLVPYITQTAAGIRECLTVFGDDYDTPDGTCLRDFIDIVDLAKAHVAAVDRMTSEKMEQKYEIFNVGTGRPLSVLELIHAFENANNLKLNYKIGPRRTGDISAVWADPTLANKKLGWKAERSIDDTMRSAWAWQCHLDGKQTSSDL